MAYKYDSPIGGHYLPQIVSSNIEDFYFPIISFDNCFNYLISYLIIFNLVQGKVGRGRPSWLDVFKFMFNWKVRVCMI